MAGESDPSIPCKILANVDTEHEVSTNPRAVQSSRPTTEDGVDLDTSVATEDLTRDLRGSSEEESVRPASESKLDKFADSSLGDSVSAVLSLRAPDKHDGGSITTHEHCTNIERPFLTRKATCDVSNELLDRIAAPLQGPTLVVTFKVQAVSHRSVLAISTDSLLHEKLAKSDHRMHSSGTEIASKLHSSNLQRERGTLSGDIKIPLIVINEVEDDDIKLENDTEFKAEIILDLEKESDEKKPLDAKALQPGPNNHDASINQDGLAQMSLATGNASFLNCKILTEKLGLDIDFTLVKPRCVAMNITGARCRNGPSKSSWEEACAILDDLVNLGPYYNAKDHADGLKLLACLVLCKNKHQGRVKELAEAWEDSLYLSVQDTDKSCLPSKKVQSHTSTSNLGDLPRKSGILEFSTECMMDFLGPRTTYSIRTMIREFVPYAAQGMDKINTGAFVEAAIKRDLLKSETIKGGCIYIYWFPGNFGHLKIGVTTRTVEARLREWQRQCNHKPILVYPISEGDRQRVPNVFRVEAIVQAELRRYRRKEVECKGCHKAHKEWFEQSSSAAIASVKKWSTWMRKEPYAINAAETTGVLKDEFKEHLRALCKVMPDAPVLGKSPQHSSPEIRRSWDTSGVRFRSRSEQPRRRSSRIADRNRRPSLVEGENTSPSFSAEFLTAASSRRIRSET